LTVPIKREILLELTVLYRKIASPAVGGVLSARRCHQLGLASALGEG